MPLIAETQKKKSGTKNKKKMGGGGIKEVKHGLKNAWHTIMR